MTDSYQDPRTDFSTLGEKDDGTWEVLIRARVRLSKIEDVQATLSARGADDDGNPNIAERAHAAQLVTGLGLVGLGELPEFLTVHVIADPSGNDSVTVRPPAPPA